MDMFVKNFKKLGETLVFGTTVAVLIIGCSGGGGGASSTSNAGVTVTGVVYPIVSGLAYQTNSASGVVAADGSYSYKAGENVSFSAGGIELAAIPAASQVTPLPLDSDVASTNLLRLFKALDTDANLSNGVALPQLSTSTLTSVDLTSASAVAAALSTISSTATLPAASDAQVASTLAAAKTTASQNMGTYGSTYKAIIVSPSAGTAITNPAAFPKDAVVNLTAQPDWVNNTIAGTATLTLSDNSTVTLPLGSTTGTYTASGITLNYEVQKLYVTARVIRMIVVHRDSNNNIIGYVSLILRDNSQANKPPVPRAKGTYSPSTGLTCDLSTATCVKSGSDLYGFDSIPVNAGGISIGGSIDLDGIVVSQTWTSSKGKTGTGNYFAENFWYYETGSVTLTVTDDEGATASKTWQIGTTSASGASGSLTLAGGISSTLTLKNYTSQNTGPVSSTNMSYSLYDGTFSPIYPSINEYARYWTTGATDNSTPLASDTIFSIYVDEDISASPAATKVITLHGRSGTNAYYIATKGGGCLVGTAPSCASVGITVNRSAGTATFVNTPMVIVPQGATAPSGSFTLNGTLSFTPF